MKPVRVLSVRKLDGDKIQRPGRDKALKESLPPALEAQTSALEPHLARTHGHKGLGLGARHLCAFLGSLTLSIATQNQKTAIRVDADEVNPAGVRREMAFHDAAGCTVFVADEAGEGGGDKEPAL